MCTLTGYVSSEENPAVVCVMGEHFLHTLDGRKLQQLISTQQHLQDTTTTSLKTSINFSYYILF